MEPRNVVVEGVLLNCAPTKTELREPIGECREIYSYYIVTPQASGMSGIAFFRVEALTAVIHLSRSILCLSVEGICDQANDS